MIFFCFLAACASLPLASATDDDTHVQPVSSRYYYEKATPPQYRAPFPTVPTAPVAQLVTNPNGLTYLLSTDGTTTILQQDGTTQPSNLPLAPPGSSMAITTTGLVQCTPSACHWYTTDSHKAVRSVTHPFGTIAALASDPYDGAVWVGGANGLVRVSTENQVSVHSLEGNVTAIAIQTTAKHNAGRIAVGTSLAVYYHYNGTHFTSWINAVGASMDGTPTALAFFEDELWIGGDWCLNVVRKDGFTVDRVAGSQGLPFGNVTSLQVVDEGSNTTTLWVGTVHGLARMTGSTTPVDGPYLQWRFFQGDRWLPGNSNVTGLGSPTSGAGAGAGAGVGAGAGASRSGAAPFIWVATTHGLAHIAMVPSTLSAKAAHYTTIASTSLSRHGWVAAGDLTKYGDPTSLVLHAGDNDGLWTGKQQQQHCRCCLCWTFTTPAILVVSFVVYRTTHSFFEIQSFLLLFVFPGMLVSGLIYEYALTKSVQAKALAWKHYAAVEFLHNVTNTHGFIARSALKCNETHGGGDSGICPAGSPNSCGWVNSSVCYAGIDHPVGHPAPASCCWTWKRDTSSDEVTGHFFTMLQAWMFLADNQDEKDRIATTLCNTANYLVEGDLLFIDPISKKGTSWGYWDPAQLNGVPGKPNERGENSLEVLGFMAAAARVCGHNDTRYAATFASLVRDHHYDINAVNAMATSPQSLAFFDFRLAFMSFHTLTLAVPDLLMANGTGYDPLIPLSKAEQVLFRSRMQQSIRRYWNNPTTGGTMNGENNWDAGMNLVYERMTGETGMLDKQWQLKRYPNEMIQWPNMNSKRWDITLVRDWLVYPNNQLVVEQSLPADESFSFSDDMTEGANCGVDLVDANTRYQAPNPFVLIYWMQQYYN